jgi:hypothetical protein
MSTQAVRRRAIVTGAASGMGRSCAERFLAEGWDVLAVDINATGLEPLREAGADTLVADLSDDPGRDLVVATAIAGPVDALVNAAGIILLKPIWDVTTSDVRRVFATNAESTFFLCQQIGPRMTEGGAIVNFSSPSAKLATTIEAAVYAATKTAILVDHPLVRLCPRTSPDPGQRDLARDHRHADAGRGPAGGRRESGHDPTGTCRSAPPGRPARPDRPARRAGWRRVVDVRRRIDVPDRQCLNYDGGYVMW